MAKISGGYIIIARKLFENSSWKGLNEAGKIVMVTLIVLANHKDKKWYNPLTKQEVLIKRGQCVIGRKSIAKQCGVGEQSVRTSLTLLKSTNFLTIQPTSRFSIITITNYEHYQNPKNYTNQVSNQDTNQVLTKSQPSPNHKQEYKNVNNEKNNKELPFFNNPNFNRGWGDFLEMRNKLRKPATTRAQELILKKLHRYSIDTAVAMLEQSIVKSWQDVFEVKQELTRKPSEAL